MELTIIMPCFNEQDAIRKTVDALVNEIASNKLSWKIIIVNDGSTDGTAQILSTLKWKLLRVIEHPYNKGYGAALKTGIRNAETEYVALFDADGQHDFYDLLNMTRVINNFDMLIGQRGKTSHRDWTRRPGKWIISKVANYLTETKIPDINSGLRVVKKDVICKLLHLFPEGFSFSTTSTIAFLNLGYNVGYYPIVAVKRIGKSTVRQFKHGSQTILLIFRLIVLFNPLKVFLPASFYLWFLGLTYEIIYGIILYPKGIKLIPAAFFLMITSIIIFFFGLVVDQLSEMRKNNFN